MIYLRYFTLRDIEWLQKNLLIGDSVDTVIDTIAAWESKRYNGYPFEMHAISDNMVTVGTISVRLHEDLFTVSLAPEILPKFRRKGYASFAMRELIERIKKSDYIIAARICKDNVAGIALHESLGYTLRGEETNDEGQKILLYNLDT